MNRYERYLYERQGGWGWGWWGEPIQGMARPCPDCGRQMWEDNIDDVPREYCPTPDYHGRAGMCADLLCIGCKSPQDQTYEWWRMHYNINYRGFMFEQRKRETQDLRMTL